MNNEQRPNESFGQGQADDGHGGQTYSGWDSRSTPVRDWMQMPEQAQAPVPPAVIQGQNPYGYAPPAYHQGYQGASTPGMAIAGFVCAFLCPLIGLGLSWAGHAKAKEIGAPTGLAIAGMVISAVNLLANIWIQIAF